MVISRPARMSKGRNSKTVDSRQKLITAFCAPSTSASVASPGPSSSRSTATSPAGSTASTPTKQRARAPIITSPSKRPRPSISVDGASSVASDSSDTAEESIQPTAIHKIIFERSYKKLLYISSTASQLSPEEKVIDAMIREYNENHKPKPQTDGDDETNSCFREENSNPIELPSYLKNYLRRDEFSVKLFVKETFSQNYILKWNESSLRNCNIHIIWFFYRNKEIFALTTNQGWNVVRNYSDFHFPIKIAARLCSEEGPKYTNDQILIGEVTRLVKKSQIGRGTHIDGNPVLCNVYTAEIRKDASILKFPCFTTDRTKDLERTCIEFGLAFVRFKRRFKVEDIPLILDHLSVISRGERTFKYETVESDSETLNEVNMNRLGQQSALASPTRPDNILTQVCPRTTPRLLFVSDEEVSYGEENFSDLYQFSQEMDESEELSINMRVRNEETDAAIYRRNLAKVPPELSAELDQALLTVLFEGIMSSKLPLGCFIFSYKNSPETFNSLPELFLNKNSLGELPVHATLRDIFDRVRPGMDQGKIKNDLWKNIRIKPLQSANVKRINWFNFVEAEMFHQDRIFWRVMKTWCTVHPAYIFSSHAWFKEFIKSHLITDDAEKHLKLPWRNHDPQRLSQQHITCNVNKHYINQYNGKKGVFLAPPKNTFLFDILYFDRKKQVPAINIYFISSNFNSQTAEAALRIFRCMEEISLALKQSPSGYFYDYLFQKNFKLEFDESSFREMLASCTFIYAVAHTPDKLTGFDMSRKTDSDNLTKWMKRSFVKERDAPSAITTIHIQKFLRLPGCPLLFEDMKKLLLLDPSEGHDEIGIYARTSIFIYKRLVAEGYVNVKYNSPTLKFLYSNAHSFSLGLEDCHCEMLAEYTKKTFAVVSHFQPQYPSLKATIELKNIASTNFLNTKFKIYEIEGE